MDETVYVFAFAERAQRFYYSARKLGLKCRIWGNTVMAEDPETLQKVCDRYYLVDPMAMPGFVGTGRLVE